MNPTHAYEAADGEPEAQKVPFRVGVTIHAYINVNVDAMDEIEAAQIADSTYVCQQINELAFDTIQILESEVDFIDPA